MQHVALKSWRGEKKTAKVCYWSRLGLLFSSLSKQRHREKKRSTLSDLALAWGYEQEPGKTGIKRA